MRRGYLTPPLVASEGGAMFRDSQLLAWRLYLRNWTAIVRIDELRRYLGGSRAASGRGPVSPESLWAETLVSSRLAEHEVWNRIHARGLGDSHGESVRLLLGRLRWIEMTPMARELR